MYPTPETGGGEGQTWVQFALVLFHLTSTFPSQPPAPLASNPTPDIEATLLRRLLHQQLQELHIKPCNYVYVRYKKSFTCITDSESASLVKLQIIKKCSCVWRIPLYVGCGELENASRGRDLGHSHKSMISHMCSDHTALY